MLAPLKRAELAQKHPWIRHVTGFHAVYGVILLATGLAHGILAGSGPAMMTGKLGWMLLLILTLLTPLKKKQSRLSGAGYILHSEQQYVYLWSCILFSRLLCNVAFATCTYRLRPHGATRTSIPLRSISVVAFATCTHRLQPHRAARTSIPLRSISVVAFATCAKKRKGLLECKHSSALSSFFPRKNSDF